MLPDAGDLSLGRAFGARLTPVVVLVTLLLTLLPPLLTAGLASQRRAREAELVGAQLATRLSDLAQRQPLVWRFNAPKVLDAVEPGRAQVRSLEITGCDGTSLFAASELGFDHAVGPYADAETAIASGPRTVAWVRVSLDRGADRVGVALVALISALVGLPIGLFLRRYPRGVVDQLGTDLERTAAERREALDALAAANRALVTRIDEAVAQNRRLAERVQAVQDAERTRIARDLHDGIGQLLTAVNVELAPRDGSAGHAGDPTARAARAREAAAQAQVELRRVVRDLAPSPLVGKPLGAALADLVESFELRTHVESTVRVQAGRVADTAVAAALLRVAQEALANVERHAQASELVVTLDVVGAHASLTIEDDGRGFDPATVRRGLGLDGMRDRIELLGGKLEIRSAPGAGCRVVASGVPLGRGRSADPDDEAHATEAEDPSGR